MDLRLLLEALEEAGKKRKCEIFGDEMKGLKIQELEKILKTNPTQQFLPS